MNKNPSRDVVGDDEVYCVKEILFFDSMSCVREEDSGRGRKRGRDMHTRTKRERQSKTFIQRILSV